jgi:mannosyl-oligosaccharide alpha-1,2-mannosidase
MDAILDHLTFMTPSRNLLYVTDAIVNANGDFLISHTFEHLTCFLPGVLALGAATLPDVPRTHLWAARGLANTCWTLYADSPTGLSPDVVIMLSGTAPADDSGLWATHLERWEQSGGHGDPPGVRLAEPVHDLTMREYKPQRRGYLLRPETVESFYLLWRTTGDAVWRERGWTIFETLLNKTRVEDVGFASISDVYNADAPKMDQMPR